MKDDRAQIDWCPFFTHGEERVSRWLVLCDHATNAVPPWVNGGNLGLSPDDMSRHIAFDPGALGVSRALADALGAPAILANFSRLVIDPNRGRDDPTLVMRLYDQTMVPANKAADAVEIQRRIDRCYAPYDAEIARLAGRRSDTVIVSVHSFTPQLRGRPPRPWHVGLLFADDDRLSRPLLGELARGGDLVVGENEPYSGALQGDTIERHALRQGRQNTLIELRNDLISDENSQKAWGLRLAAALQASLPLAEKEVVKNG